MRFSLGISMMFIGCLATTPAVEPRLELRLLQMDHRSAALLENEIRDKAISAVRFEERLDAMIKSRSMSELGRFVKEPVPNGEIVSFKQDIGEIKVADDQSMPMGIMIETEPTFGGAGLMNMRLAFERYSKKSRNKIVAAKTHAAVTLENDRWKSLSAWGDESQRTVLLGKASGLKHEEQPGNGRLWEVHYQSELRWCEPADLKTFGKSTPATQAKAVDWLLKRSELIATSDFRETGGNISTQENGLYWIHDDQGWDTKQLGLVLNLRGMLGPGGDLVDVQVAGTWHPTDAGRPPKEPEFSYQFATTTGLGTTFVIGPEAPRDAKRLPVIFMTPNVEVLMESKRPPRDSRPPAPDQLGSVVYPVHPSLMRKLAEVAKFEPQAGMPRIMAQPALRDLLEDTGLEFTAGTSVSFDTADCNVILTHHAKGHQTMVEILTKHNLLADKRD